jgi:hypothetical protein
MPADGFTKTLSRQRHEHFVKQLNLIDIKPLLSTGQAASSDAQEAGGVCQPIVLGRSASPEMGAKSID